MQPYLGLIIEPAMFPGPKVITRIFIVAGNIEAVNEGYIFLVILKKKPLLMPNLIYIQYNLFIFWALACGAEPFIIFLGYFEELFSYVHLWSFVAFSPFEHSTSM